MLVCIKFYIKMVYAMKIIIISGFLGSGKTTLLLSLARFFAGSGFETAIIENEIGNVPVDSILLKSEGFSVRELFAGCICCSIRQDLSAAVQDIKQTVNPDILLIEPTGVAAPGIVTDIISESLGDGDSAETLLVVDYKRVGTEVDHEKSLRKLPFLARSLQVCDHLLLNIPDKIDDNILHSVTSALSRTAGGKLLHVVDARDQKKVGDFAREMGNYSNNTKKAVSWHVNTIHDKKKLSLHGSRLSKDFSFLQGLDSSSSVPLAVEYDQSSVPHDHMHLENTAIVTFSETFSPGINEKTLKITQMAKSMMMHIGKTVKETARDAEGHIKAYITTGKDGETQDGLFLNMIRFGSELSVQGSIPVGTSPLTLVVNAIVFSIQQDDLKQIIQDHTGQFLSQQENLIDVVS